MVNGLSFTNERADNIIQTKKFMLIGGNAGTRFGAKKLIGFMSIGSGVNSFSEETVTGALLTTITNVGRF
jgi:hypothetical protein